MAAQQHQHLGCELLLWCWFLADALVVHHTSEALHVGGEQVCFWASSCPGIEVVSSARIL
jgi:hypothetical protein